MNGKVFLTGKGFGETCRYVCERQEHSRVLAVEGVRGHDPRLMAEDFEWQHRLMPEKEKPVFHSVLSFPPGEKVADDRLVEIGRRYMQEIGMGDTQYAFVKHTDTEHLHMHIIANRVDNHGEPTGKGLIIERSIKAAQALTNAYGLRQEDGKHLQQTNLLALHEPDAKRYRVYQAISDELPGCLNFEELEKRLAERQVSVRYRWDEGGKERVGISFRMENRSFKGSQVDAAFSYRRLEQTLALQQRQAEEMKVRQELELRQAKEDLAARVEREEELSLRLGRGLRMRL